MAVLFCLIVALASAVCPGQNLPQNPSSPGDRGNWPVGSKYVANFTLAQRNISAEVFYPAIPGSNKGLPTNIYDLRDYLPPNEEFLIPDDDAPYQFSNATFDLPLDTSYGPYPVIIFIHGTSGWKGQSQHSTEHWASRGFIVVSANYPGIFMRDMLMATELQPTPSVDQVNDTQAILSQLRNLTNPDLFFLKASMDLTRITVIGHSAGGAATEKFVDDAQVLIVLAAGGRVEKGTQLKSFLTLEATNDSVAGGQPTAEELYRVSPSPKRMAVMEFSGHLFCTDICWVKEDEGGLVGVAQKYKIWQAFIPAFIKLGTDGCPWVDPTFLEPPEGWAFTNFMTAAVVEETQLCDSSMAQKIRDYAASYQYMSEYLEDLSSETGM